MVREVGKALRPGFEAVYEALDPKLLEEEDELGAAILASLEEGIAMAGEAEEMIAEDDGESSSTTS